MDTAEVGETVVLEGVGRRRIGLSGVALQNGRPRVVTFRPGMRASIPPLGFISLPIKMKLSWLGLGALGPSEMRCCISRDAMTALCE